MYSSSVPRWNSTDSFTPTVKMSGSMPVNVFCAMILRPSASTRSATGSAGLGGFFGSKLGSSSSHPNAFEMDHSPLPE